MTSIALDELASHKGKVLGQSPWMTVTQDMIQAFADATGEVLEHFEIVHRSAAAQHRVAIVIAVFARQTAILQAMVANHFVTSIDMVSDVRSIPED